MTNEIKNFDFNGAAVRVVMQGGKPWWVTKDVCEYFGDANYRRSIAGLENDEKGVSQIHTPRRNAVYDYC